MRDYNMMRDMLVFASVAEYVETDIGSHTDKIASFGNGSSTIYISKNKKYNVNR